MILRYAGPRLACGISSSTDKFCNLPFRFKPVALAPPPTVFVGETEIELHIGRRWEQAGASRPARPLGSLPADVADASYARKMLAPAQRSLNRNVDSRSGRAPSAIGRPAPLADQLDDAPDRYRVFVPALATRDAEISVVEQLQKVKKRTAMRPRYRADSLGGKT